MWNPGGEMIRLDGIVTMIHAIHARQFQLHFSLALLPALVHRWQPGTDTCLHTRVFCIPYGVGNSLMWNPGGEMIRLDGIVTMIHAIHASDS
jgi:hypothetical protein